MTVDTNRPSASGANATSSLGDQAPISAPCAARCPAGVDVPGYLNAIAEGRFSEALRIVVERNPLPSVCGRVCVRPCEEGCRRCKLDEPVAIASLKRAAADLGVYPSVDQSIATGFSAAIVGSGPAGLTAAHDLVGRGFRVTVYDAKDRVGGMLRHGIPNYRLPDYALNRDIEYLISCGIDFETGVRIGEDISIEELQERYDAVIIAVGLQGSRALPIPGAEAKNVLAALCFLEEAASGDHPAMTGRVVVVGGGNVAIDVARTALRLGASEVMVTCLESEDEMPASEHEIQEAYGEGVRFNCSWGPVSVKTAGDCVDGLSVVKCTSVFDSNGAFSPTFDETTATVLQADTVIFATGQTPQTQGLDVGLSPRGLIEIDDDSMCTTRHRVYAAGDAVTGPRRVIDAIAQGHRVAACVMRDLLDDSSALEACDAQGIAIGEVPDSMRKKIQQRARVQMDKLEFYECTDSFAEIEFGYTPYEAAREAQRCLGCTSGARLAQEKCASCLTCMRVCPYGAPGVRVGGYLYFDAEACHACGACAAECPAQALSIEGHSDEEMERRIHHVLAGTEGDTTLMFNCSCTPNPPTTVEGALRHITTNCLLRVSDTNVMKALRSGATRVAFAGCVEANCRYPHTRILVEQRIERIRAVLAEIGLEESVTVFGESHDEDVHIR